MTLPSRSVGSVADGASTRRRAIIAGIVGNVMEWYDFGTYGFFAPCSLLAITAWLSGGNAGTTHYILNALAGYQPLSEDNTVTDHSAGLNFSRSWGDIAAYNLTSSSKWLTHFGYLFGYEMGLSDIWDGSYPDYAHWVAQFGVFGIWLKSLRLPE